jgi:hypothetical protein
MALAQVQLAEVGQGVEVSQEGFGDGGEVGAPTNVVELGDELATDADASGVTRSQDSVRLEELQVSRELLAIKVREGLAFVCVHLASAEEPALFSQS